MPATLVIATTLAALAASVAVTAPATHAVTAPATLAVPAALQDEVFVEVNPSTIEAGEQVGIRASCPDNNKAATVESDIFGEVTVEPRFGFLTASVKVPESQQPRTVVVQLRCPGGQTATATLHVVADDRPTQGPATGFGGTAGDGSGGLLIGAGLLTIAAGLLLGVITLRRRRAYG